ncbi:AraC family transcriptional regulator [Kitasatospora paranensis]|uniref:AraC family transcriptional regulator n=1 Tax=Kitasatospora paranensis TaxID=258053 RepID=A0ABW2FYI6_9ACTN
MPDPAAPPPARPETIARGLADWDFPRSPAGVLLLAEFAAERGIDRERLLAGTGIAEADLGDPHGIVQARQEIAVVRNLLRALGDRPGLGLEVGARFHLTTYGTWGYALLSSATLGDAFRVGAEFAELTFAFCRIRLERSGDVYTARLGADTLPPDVRRFLVERDSAASTVIRRELFGDPEATSLRRVVLGFEAGTPEPYERFFRGPVVLGGPTTELVSDAALLDRVLPQANPLTARACVDACRRLLAERARAVGTAHRVRARLTGLQGVDDGIEQTAQALGMTSRTLRRRLDAEGTGYRELVDEVRYGVAREALGRGGVSTEELARRLGYAEPSSFVRAFRRWAGTTPQNWALQQSLPPGR